MILDEFRNEFDILYNSIASNAAPSIDDYEKSVLLTIAQEELVKQLYNGGTVSVDSLDNTEELREYLSNLIIEKEYNNDTEDTVVIFEKEEDLMFIIREFCIIDTECFSGEINVVPTTLNDLNRSLNNPFKKPSDNKVLRINTNEGLKLYSKYPIRKYHITYLKTPNPIILSDLEDGLSINNKSTASDCELDSNLHRAILNSAVALAKATYVV